MIASTSSRIDRELRSGEDGSLQRRRAIVVLSFIAGGCMQIIGLYQMGLISRVPEPRAPGVDSERAEGGKDAYAGGMVPHTLLSMLSYGLTAVIAALGGRGRARHQPWIPIAMSAKTMVDAAHATTLTRRQYRRHRAVSFWGVVAIGATAASLALALPEAFEAAKRITKESK
jgi:hypothetical protein